MRATDTRAPARSLALPRTTRSTDRRLSPASRVDFAISPTNNRAWFFALKIPENEQARL